ncbi:MAG: type VII toxin-antitoxin system MntA family adenylyltransferase antitoxin [Anaerolineales bacterium]
MEIETILKDSRAILSTNTHVLLAYLFGSQANKTTGPLSDIDIAILFQNNEDTVSLSLELSSEMSKKFPSHRIEVIALNKAPIELAYAVIAQGICIYQKDNYLRIEFEAQVLSRYGDFLCVLRNQRQEILEGKGDEHRVQRYREALRRTERTISQIRTL